MELTTHTPAVASAGTTSAAPPRLRRVLTLGDLIIYGIVAVTPSAPVTVFGLAQVRSHGHALLTILLAMVAMIFTGISYGRMAARYPSAGSAYTYVGHGLNPYLGFLTGWAMLLDYLVIPVFCVIYGSLAAQRLLPGVPFAAWALLIAGGMTALNLFGIRSTAWANKVLLVSMMVVLLAFDVLAVAWIVHHLGAGALFTWKPVYNPATFQWRAIGAATSFSALTYLGFDSVTTLAEDVENPRRNVLLAAVLVCLFTGVFGGLLIYLAQIVWPDPGTFTNVETAFMDVTRVVGGAALFAAMAGLLVVANIGSGLTGQVGAARLLFSMGRDRVLPPRFFAHLDPRRNTPVYNILAIGVLAFAGAMVMSYEVTAEVLNFGAFLGFIGVNLAAFYQFFIRQSEGRRRWLLDGLLPLLGLLFCLAIWIGLSRIAMTAGSLWLAVGLVYLAIRTGGFRRAPALSSFAEETL